MGRDKVGNAMEDFEGQDKTYASYRHTLEAHGGMWREVLWSEQWERWLWQLNRDNGVLSVKARKERFAVIEAGA